MSVSVEARGVPPQEFFYLCFERGSLTGLRLTGSPGLCGQGAPGICLYLPRLGVTSVLQYLAFYLVSEAQTQVSASPLLTGQSPQPLDFLFCHNGDGPQGLTQARQAFSQGATPLAHRGHCARGGDTSQTVVWKCRPLPRGRREYLFPLATNSPDWRH